MSNPWMDQPEVSPYPTGAEVSDEQLTRALGMVGIALGYLPATCRYHGTNLDPSNPAYDACCETGEPARARREAVDAIRRLPRPLLAEAERRGAERGWDEGYGAADYDPGNGNPYRKAAQQ